jgi:hypothetical protein
MGTAAQVASTATRLQTPQSVVQRAAPSATPTQGSVARPSPTLDPGQVTLTVSPQDKEGQSSYVLFGVFMAILIGVIVAIVIQRKK